MVSAEQAYREIAQTLNEAGLPDAAQQANLLLQKVAGLSRFSFEGEVNERQMDTLRGLAARRAKREPLQYLLGSWPFMDLELYVGPGVLVPRPETELVCEGALELIADMPHPRVLDLCAGTGALGLGIASQRPDAQVWLVEKYPEAVGYLVRNTDMFTETYGDTHPHEPVVVCEDVFKAHDKLPKGFFNCIVSNPPYVTEGEYAALEPELYHEPKTALVAEEDGLLFYKAIAREYKASLAPGGVLVFEIGAAQGAAVQAVLRENGYRNIRVAQDYSGLDRVAVGMAL